MRFVNLLLSLLLVFTAVVKAESDPVEDQINQLLLVRDTIIKTLDSIAEKEGIKDADMKELCFRWREAFYNFVQKAGFIVDKEGWVKIGDNEYVKYDNSCRVHKRIVEVAVNIDEKDKKEIKNMVTHKPLPKTRKTGETFKLTGYRVIAFIMLAVITIIFIKGITESLLARRGVEAFIRFLIFLFLGSLFYSLMKLLPA